MTGFNQAQRAAPVIGVSGAAVALVISVYFLTKGLFFVHSPLGEIIMQSIYFFITPLMLVAAFVHSLKAPPALWLLWPGFVILLFVAVAGAMTVGLYYMPSAALVGLAIYFRGSNNIRKSIGYAMILWALLLLYALVFWREPLILILGVITAFFAKIVVMFDSSKGMSVALHWAGWHSHYAVLLVAIPVFCLVMRVFDTKIDDSMLDGR
ncbi:MAG: hypothetical protein H0Z39_05635 [Peptococcaceae bacterium]|nr:hypothetical protein [Peptococcaceae bacterium]